MIAHAHPEAADLKLQASQRMNQSLVEALRRWLLYKVALMSPDGTPQHRQLIEQRLREATATTALVLN